MIFHREIHQKIYTGSLLLLSASLPLSEFGLSLAMFIMSANWLLEGGFRRKWSVLRTNWYVSLFLFVYLLHFLGIFYSADLRYGFHDLRIKLPMLLLPVLILTSLPVSRKELILVFYFLVFSSLAAALAGLAKWAGLFSAPASEPEEIAVFISHIRLALIVVFSIFIAFYLVLSKGQARTGIGKAILLLSAAVLCLFLLLLKSVTGIIVFILILLFSSIYAAKKIRSLTRRIFILSAALGIILVIGSYIIHSVGRYNRLEEVDLLRLENITPDGNKYMHYPDIRQTENGYYVWLYVCEPELEQAWNKRSSIGYHERDRKGQWIRFTLIRYLTSKGLRKDAGGIRQLDEKDVIAVENGVANHIYLERFALYPKVYEILWQIDNYRRGGVPDGHSVTQRLEYWRIALKIIAKNPWFGVGTGDVAAVFQEEYENGVSDLSARWRLRAHNQFLTLLIAFGWIGGLAILLAISLFFRFARKRIDLVTIVFLLIIFFSMFTEDTLETHTGVSFFAFFFSLLIFGSSRDDIGTIKDRVV